MIFDALMSVFTAPTAPIWIAFAAMVAALIVIILIVWDHCHHDFGENL